MIKRLSKCIREYKLTSILAPISITMEVVMDNNIYDNFEDMRKHKFVKSKNRPTIRVCFGTLMGGQVVIAFELFNLII